MEQPKPYHFNSLIDLVTKLEKQEDCKLFLRQLRWNQKITCPHCGFDGKIYKLKNNYKCSDCKQPFSETKGTIFENSSVSLCKWFVAIWMVTTNRKGVSSTQLARDLKVTQKTAWNMIDRIQKAYIVIQEEEAKAV